MNLLNHNFYSRTISKQSENTLIADIAFHASHTIFEGHFPGQPVVPGVCLMQIVKENLEMATGKTLRITAAPQIKFLQLITPETAPSLHLTWTVAEGQYVTNATFQSEKPLTKLTMQLLEVA